MTFEWDEEKEEANVAKHGVSFEEAKTILEDPLYVDFYDPDHSQDEHRYIMIGLSNQGSLLIASYAGCNDMIRMITARQVTRSEREAYEEGQDK